jgi:hypothetical protein
MIPTVAVSLWACSGPDTPPPGGGRELAGPFVGRHLALDGDALWVSAPGPEEPDGVLGTWSRLVAPVGGSLADADRTVTEGEEGDLGGGLAVCADGTVIAGGPLATGRGGAWILGPADDETGEQAFAEGLYADGRAGVAVACGDLDGQGGPDFVVTAPASDTVVPGAGTLGVYALVDGAPDKIANLDTTWSNAALGDGTALVLADVTGDDGVQDLLVAGPGSDRVHLVPGPLRGAYVANSAGPTFQGTDGEQTGASLAAGDLTGDGVLDLVIGTPEGAGGRGGVWILPGPLGSAPQLLRDGARWLGGISIGARLGAAVAVPGDVDGDGTDDLLIGAPDAPGAGPDAGAAYLVLGASLDRIADIDGADAILLPEAPRGRFGSAVAGGDLDGDGVFELYVSAPEADVDGITGVGEVVVFPATVRGTVYDADGASGTVRP